LSHVFGKCGKARLLASKRIKRVALNFCNYVKNFLFKHDGK